MLIWKPRIQPSIGTRMLIYTAFLLCINGFFGLIAIVTDMDTDILLYGFCFGLAVSALVGPIIGFPIWFLYELLKRSRQTDFPRRRSLRLLEVSLIIVIIYLFIFGKAGILGPRDGFLTLSTIASIYARLRRPRSPWPRILYIYGFRWLILLLCGPFTILFIGATLELSQAIVMIATLSVPLLWLCVELYVVACAHKGRSLRLPTRCVLLLRSFGLDDENFIETKRSFFSMLDPDHGIPFDVFVCSAIETQLAAFVSFGDPGDVALRPGARRYYMPDTRWRPVFEDLTSRTIAFLAIADTINEGFAWELMRLRQLGLHTRLFLFTAPSRKPRKKPLLLVAYEGAGQVLLPRRHMRDVEGSWRRAAFNLRPIGYQLTDYPGPGAVIGFATDGTALVLARNCEEPNEFIAPVREMLYPNMNTNQ